MSLFIYFKYKPIISHRRILNSGWSTPFVSQELLYGTAGSVTDMTGRVTAKITRRGNADRRYDYTYSESGFLRKASYSSKSNPKEDYTESFFHDLHGNMSSYGCLATGERFRETFRSASGQSERVRVKAGSFGFTSPDRMAWKYTSTSPYAYCMGDPINLTDPTGMYATEKEALEVSEEKYNGAKVLQDEESGFWYIELDETGTKAPESGENITRYFGDFDPYVVKGSLFSTVASGFSSANGTKMELIKYGMKGTEMTGAMNRYLKLNKYVEATGAAINIADAGNNIATYIQHGGKDKKVVLKYTLDIAIAAGSIALSLFVPFSTP